MALAAGTQWEARTTGSDTLCAGGFNPANANFPTDGAATSATGNSPVFTSASYTFVAGDVGAWLFVKSGTNWTPGWYEITSVTGGAATLKAAIGEAVAYPGAFLTTNGALMVPNTVAGCATTASPTGATWGVDYSQQAAAKFAFTDLATASNTTVTSAANPFGKNCVGNLIKITAGTGWTVQTCEITSVTTVTATLDKAAGTHPITGGTGYLGGCFAGPQLACALSVAGNKIWTKSGAYTMSSTTQNIALGKIVLVSATQIEGYGTLRGDLGTAPVFTASGISGVNMMAGGTMTRMVNLTMDGSSLATITGFGNGTTDYVEYCKAVNCVTGFSSGSVFKSTADVCTTGFTGASGRDFCVAKTCTTGFTNGFCSNTVAISCTTGYSGTGGAGWTNANAYGCTNGFVFTSGVTFAFRCVASTSSSRGFDFTSGTGHMHQCAAYNSTTADVRYGSSGTFGPVAHSLIALSADPFTNAAGGDFSINNTAGGGAALRGLSVAWPSIISTTGYPDAGAVQHLESASGGGGKIFASSIIQGHGII